MITSEDKRMPQKLNSLLDTNKWDHQRTKDQDTFDKDVLLVLVFILLFSVLLVIGRLRQFVVCSLDTYKERPQTYILRT